jgi:hypothetical protein
MLQIGNTIISLDIIECKFLCDLSKCKGACCIHGDSGAPLEEEEVAVLNEIYPLIKHLLSGASINTIEKFGTSVIDCDGDIVTPLNDGKECAFTVFENGIAKCAIELAYQQKIISFLKPISCHLYPIRITKYNGYDALNYHQWEICQPAIESGMKNNVSIHEFLQGPLTRKYGKDWVNELKIAAEILPGNLKKQP